jgi:hypothetical protein
MDGEQQNPQEHYRSARRELIETAKRGLDAPDFRTAPAFPGGSHPKELPPWACPAAFFNIRQRKRKSHKRRLGGRFGFLLPSDDRSRKSLDDP